MYKTLPRQVKLRVSINSQGLRRALRGFKSWQIRLHVIYLTLPEMAPGASIKLYSMLHLVQCPKLLNEIWFISKIVSSTKH